jgi:cellulose synthase/poly-beta-1,6-N-acetylglucosamine synthase-like glycosyltransferase
MNIGGAVLAAILVGGGAVYFTVCIISLLGLLRSYPTADARAPAVSVIVAARNAEETIGSLLDDLLGQDYPTECVEILPVDDDSEDGTPGIIRSYACRDHRVKSVETPDSRSPLSHKKKAVYKGILSSHGEVVMTVDSDCRVPGGWIHGLMRHFTPGVELVAGEVRIEGKGLLAWLETLEFTGIQCMAAGLANMRFPVTCNGANLAYRRAAFERVRGFEGIGGFVSGDDDLLMQKIARGNPSRVVFAVGSETAVRVPAVASIREFLSKRSRWASKIRGYSSHSAVALLVLFFVFFAAVPVGLGCSLAGFSGYGALAAGYGLKTAGDALLTGYGLARAGKAGILLVFPLAELLHVPYILGVTLNGFFGRFEWRGRYTGARRNPIVEDYR